LSSLWAKKTCPACEVTPLPSALHLRNISHLPLSATTTRVHPPGNSGSPTVREAEYSRSAPAVADIANTQPTASSPAVHFIMLSNISDLTFVVVFGVLAQYPLF
jgi:hypothetical protein